MATPDAPISTNPDQPSAGAAWWPAGAVLGHLGRRLCRTLQIVEEQHARLFAAAPDLLAALQAVEAHHVHLNEKHGRAPGRSRTLGIVRAALAKVYEGAQL